MRLIRNLPIERKLTIITVATTAAALLLACIGFTAYETIVFRGRMVEELTATAMMIADNTASALAFGDAESARQTLQALRAHPHIVEATIHGFDGSTFAVYARDGVAETVGAHDDLLKGHRFEGDYLTLFRGIEVAGERAGTIYVRSDLKEMYARLRRYGLIIVLVLVTAGAAAFGLTRRLHRSITGPVSHLAQIVGIVAKRRDYSVRAIKESADELGDLMDGFNDMLDQIQRKDSALEEARQSLERRVEERTAKLRDEIAGRELAQAELQKTHEQLVTASRQAGMAEIATNVLHNVGNVLNSVNVSATLVADLVQKSKAAGLARVVALMREREHDLGSFITTDARGRHLPAHLSNLAEHLASERGVVLSEVESLRANIEHIKDIVAMQQSYARVGGVNEIISVVDLIEDTLRMNSGALSRHQVEVVRDYRARPRANVDKHKVLQILVNLVRNAKYACDESHTETRRIVVRVGEDAGRVRIAVIDNGVGIPPENLARIFNHGFTTRANGHGFGLHSGALAARELGGSLSVASEGVGCGAAFTLELPSHVAEATDAA